MSTVQRSMMTCPPFHSIPPRRETSLHLAHPTHYHLVAILVIRATVSASQCLCSSPLFCFIMAPKSESTHAGNSDVPLLCLIQKFHFTQVSMYKNKHTLNIHRNQYYPQFQASPGDLEMYTLQIRGNHYISWMMDV